MGDNPDDLPFRAEYAKSGRAKCKACKADIPKGDLRIASMTQSPFFDGKQANWFHWNCFFSRNRPKAVGEIAHFDSLRWEDQERITKKIEDGPLAEPAPAGKKGKKAGKGAAGGQMVDGTLLGDFRTEYAKSGAAKCRKCEEKIKKGEVRICKKDYDDDRAKQYGPLDRWYHLDCFASNRDEMVFFCSGDQLAGYKTLSKEDQDLVSEKLPKVKRKMESGGKDEPDSKKAKLEVKEDPAEAGRKEEMKKQNKKMFYYRDLLSKNLKKQELYNLLEHNKQEIPTGEDRALDRLSDIMTFGALEPCQECGGGQLVYQSGLGYRCQGDLSEWTKCQVVSQAPARRPFKIPADYKQEYDFLAMYKSKTGTRIIPNLPGVAKTPAANGNQGGQGTSTSALLPLKNMKFVLSGKMDKEKYQGKIEALGGSVINSVTKEVIALISDKETLAEERSKVKEAKKQDVPVILKEFLAGVKTEGVVSMVKQHTISDWGREPDNKIQKARAAAEQNGGGLKSSASRFLSQAPKSVKLKLKGGAYVDPDSELEDKAHVLKERDSLYSAVLGAVNIQDGKNSYYKLQVLEHDKKKKWFVFRSWGRVGTTIGGTKLQNYEDKHEALREFEFLYEEKTGNRWKNRKDFKKVAGKFYPLDIDLGENNEEIKKLSVKDSKSSLAKPIQELVTLVFDIERMKNAMVEFEIDLTKMPLGKLSRKQVETAYKILTEVQDMIKNSSGSDSKYLDASNRFFTLIPHDFGMKSPPKLDNPDLVKSKIDMLDNLLEIEVAYNLLSCESEDVKGKDPIDAHYAKLKTEIHVLGRDTEEWKVLEEYVTNTHAATHSTYTLEIEEIFKVSRKGENKRFKPFKALPNRMLLWHGSRTTNFAGILSQGLRIAPPEAPVTGYMFGKGVYFADMVSKSANYCCTSRTNNTGLLLLCDVALGNMYEARKAEYVEKLPTGFHSTKGLGKTAPDATNVKEIDGATVPVGCGVKDSNLQTDLLYNEFIVYDVGQVNSKYLFRMKFNYKI